MTDTATITELHCYPLKSAAGHTLQRAALGDTGLRGDREWMLVDERGHFFTQRELPQLALLAVRIEADWLQLGVAGRAPVRVAATATDHPCSVRVWNDDCQAFDAGEAAAQWLAAWLQRPCRLVRFDRRAPRLSSSQWTGNTPAHNAFSDGYPLLVIGAASLDDLNRRLPHPLPMNRFRPNIVVAGLPPYGEDRVHELQADGLRLRLVKPCTRCAITATSQERGERDGEQPLRTLRDYRYDPGLRGVLFGQNAIIVEGIGRALHVGQQLRVSWR